MEDLNNQEKDIEEQIRILQMKKDEIRKAREAEERKITISFHSFNSMTGRIKLSLSKYRPDVVDMLRWFPSRAFDGKDNIIDATSVADVLKRLDTLGDITVLWNKKDKEQFDEWVNAPDVLVDIDEKKGQVTLKLGPKMINNRLWLTSEITSFTQELKRYVFSIAELHKFPDAIARFYPNIKIEYTEAARAVLFKELEHRKAIAEIANAKDVEMDNPFCENCVDINGKRLEPKPHQRVAVKFAELSGGKTLIAYDMGTGKTAIAIAYAERNIFKHVEKYGKQRVLIVCPASLKTNWKRMIKQFTGKDANVLQGIEPDELAISTLIDDRFQYHLINYDVIGRTIGKDEDAVMKWVAVFNAIGFDLIVLDECHYIKNMDSKRSIGVRALNNYKDILPMSGTPLVNRPMELFPALHIINPETFPSPTQFANNFVDQEGRAKNITKLHELLMPYMIRRTRTDVYGELEIERIPFTKELSPTARAYYQKVLEGIYISLRNPDYSRNVTSILAELIRCKQICSADNCQTSADIANDALEETGKKVIVFSQFKESHATIQQYLGRSSAVINGDIGDDLRYELIDKFQDPNSELKVIVTNILEGLTMTEAHTVIFNDLWWTPKDHSQAEGRAFGRDNDPHGGNAYYIQNENTIDEFINALLMRKMELFKQIVDGVRVSQDAEVDIVKALINHLRNSI